MSFKRADLTSMEERGASHAPDIGWIQAKSTRQELVAASFRSKSGCWSVGRRRAARGLDRHGVRRPGDHGRVVGREVMLGIPGRRRGRWSVVAERWIDNPQLIGTTRRRSGEHRRRS